MKPEIINKQKIFYFTCAYPPAQGGSTIINRNLLSYFNEDSYVLIKTKRKIKKGFNGFLPKHYHDVFHFYDKLPRRLFTIFTKLELPFARWKLNRLIKKYKPAIIVSVYPDYFFLKLARDVAKNNNLPLVIYLHDTLAEALTGTSLEKDAQKLQNQVFQESDLIWVMSEGMQKLYQSKHNLSSHPLVHSYLEDIPDGVEEYKLKKTAFWGGSIYPINKNAVKRTSEAIAKMGFTYKMAIAASATSEMLKEHYDVEGSHIELCFYSDRNEYIDAVKNTGLLTLALDWPDESPIHRDELATIFPTKTIEYLASGGLIVAHCPEDYFMAQFIKKHNCGVVVSEKSADALVIAIQNLLASPSDVQTYRANALKAAKTFSITNVAQEFSGKLSKIYSDKILNNVE